MKEAIIHYNEALKLESEGGFKKALKKYKESLLIDNRFFEAWLNSGVLFSKLNKPVNAITCYKKALSVKKDGKAFYNLAAEYYKQEDYQSAIEYLEESIEINEREGRAYLLCGYSYLKVKNYESAKSNVLKALKLDPENSSAYIATIIVLNESNSKKQARLLINKAKKEFPGQQIFIKMSAVLDLDENKFEESIKEYRKIIKADLAVLALGETYINSIPVEQQKVIKSQEKLLINKENKDKKDFFDLSLISMFQGRGENALEYLQSATTPDKND